MTPITALGSRYGIQGALGRSVKRTAVDTSWWLAGGISSEDCTIAFQPLRADSAAASLLPVHGSLSGALSSSLASGWSADKGWYCDGANNKSYGMNEIALFAGLSNSNCSWVIKIANPVSSATTDREAFAIRYGAAYSRLVVTLSGNIDIYNIGSISTGTAASGVYGFGGTTAYVNGSSIGTISSATYGASSNLDAIGCSYAGARAFAGEIHALAFYDTALTSAQMSALTTAMNAL